MPFCTESHFGINLVMKMFQWGEDKKDFLGKILCLIKNSFTYSEIKEKKLFYKLNFQRCKMAVFLSAKINFISIFIWNISKMYYSTSGPLCFPKVYYEKFEIYSNVERIL